MDVFFSDADRAEYKRQLSEQGLRFGVEYIAWCLMTNDVHLVAIPKEGKSLALVVREAFRSESLSNGLDAFCARGDEARNHRVRHCVPRTPPATR